MIVGSANSTFTLGGTPCNLTYGCNVAVYGQSSNSAYISSFDPYGNFQGSASATDGSVSLYVAAGDYVVVSGRTPDFYRTTGWDTNASNANTGSYGAWLSASAVITYDTYFGIRSDSVIPSTFWVSGHKELTYNGANHIAEPFELTSMSGVNVLDTIKQTAIYNENSYEVYVRTLQSLDYSGVVATANVAFTASSWTAESLETTAAGQVSCGYKDSQGEYAPGYQYTDYNLDRQVVFWKNGDIKSIADSAVWPIQYLLAPAGAYYGIRPGYQAYWWMNETWRSAYCKYTGVFDISITGSAR